MFTTIINVLFVISLSTYYIIKHIMYKKERGFIKYLNKTSKFEHAISCKCDVRHKKFNTLIPEHNIIASRCVDFDESHYNYSQNKTYNFN